MRRWRRPTISQPPVKRCGSRRFKNRPLASVIQKAFDVNANYLMMAARMMPESAYGFRPTPDLRTFGEQINHATAAQYSFCNQAGVPPGVERRPAPSLRQVTAKADIVESPG